MSTLTAPTIGESIALARVTYEPAPTGAPADAPRVFAAINGVMRDAMPVGKNQRNQQQNYNFRGIDDVMSAMSGPMRTHGVFILPSIVDHRAERRGEKMTHVTIKMRYHVYGPAGDCLIAEVPGEASDFADKATNKAQSAALKYLLFTLFMLPVDSRSIDDGDRHHPTEQGNEQPQQRQQQRRGQQRQQRRDDQGEQQPKRQAPSRDFLAEATKAPDRATFDQVRAAAVKAGAPADYLDRIDAVARQRATAANQPQRHRDPEPGDQQQAPPTATPAANPERAAAEAENALRLAASRANLPNLDADFQRVYGLPVEQATAAQLNAFRQKIETAQ